MIHLNYPKPDFKIKKEREQNFLFDPIRKIWVLLTPEEWVRQNFVQYLISILKYPAGLIALEKELLLNDQRKRFDILVYDKAHRPWMLVECKAAEIKLNDDVLQQVLRYNISIPALYLVITNGAEVYGWVKEGGTLRPLPELPQWS
jgi:hypothetical protein